VSYFDYILFVEVSSVKSLLRPYKVALKCVKIELILNE